MKKIQTFTTQGIKGYRGTSAIFIVPGADAEVIITAANAKELAKFMAHIPPGGFALNEGMARETTVVRMNQ